MQCRIHVHEYFFIPVSDSAPLSSGILLGGVWLFGHALCFGWLRVIGTMYPAVTSTVSTYIVSVHVCVAIHLKME